MEELKLRNFLLLYPNFTEDNIFMGIDQNAQSSETYALDVIPTTKILETYVNGTSRNSLSCSIQYKIDIKDVEKGGHIDSSKAYEFHNELNKWIKDINNSNGFKFQSYYDDNINDRVEPNLDFRDWEDLQITQQPSLLSINERQAIYSSTIVLIYKERVE